MKMGTSQRFFVTHPVFRRDEYVAFLDENGGSTGPSSVSSLLRFHANKGHIVKIRRGLYGVIPVGADLKRFRVDRALVGGRAWSDGALAFHTALELHGYAQSVFEQVHVLCPESRRGFMFQGTEFVPCKQPTALLDSGHSRTEVRTTERRGLEIDVTSLERTIVDCLAAPEYGGGWEEIARSLSSIPYVDVDALVSYALLLDNATTVAKVGLLLELQTDAWFVEDSQLERLEQAAPSSPRYAGREQASTFVPRWNLMAPDIVLEQWNYQ